jgi:CheY-like chemotaxis protein
VLERKQPLYLVLTDLEMPGMDGIELTCQLRERRLTENLIVVSARDPRLLEIIENMACEDTSIGLLGTLLAGAARCAGAAAVQGRRPWQRPRPLVPPPPQASLEELAQALTRHEFVPYFQPKIAMQNGHLKGWKRWRAGSIRSAACCAGALHRYAGRPSPHGRLHAGHGAAGAGAHTRLASARPAAADGVGQPVGRQPGRPQFYRPPDGAGVASGVPVGRWCGR